MPMAKFLSILLLLGGLAAVAPASPTDPALSRAFGPGERLTFAISYLGLHAGTAVLQVANGPTLKGRPTWRLQTNAWSEPPVSTFFKVDDRIESLVDAENLVPYHMVFHKREGKKEMHLDVTFHHAEGTVTTIKDGVSETVPLPAGSQHAFSALYYLRDRSNVQVGDALTLNVHHEKKNYPLNARVERLDKIRGRWGRTQALEVIVNMPFRGIWLNEGNMRLWVTSDARHVPLKIKAKVVIGSIVAELVEGPGIAPEPEAGSNSF